MATPGSEPSVLVIGYGNRLRADDGAGWEAARRLQRRLPARSATVRVAHQLLPEMAEPISRANLVVFIDARAGGGPGQVRRRQVRAARLTDGAVGHFLDPGGLLRLARALYGRAPRALLYSIGAVSFDHTMDLSPPVRRGLQDLVHDVVRDVGRFRSQRRPARA